MASNDTPTPSVSRDCVETAYSFFHQKERIYIHSTLDWQKDDIEYAIESYVDDMNKELYLLLSNGRKDFLRNHTTFASDISHAVETLEKILFG